MNWFRKIPVASLAVIVGIVTAVGWITLDGTVPLVISIVAGGLVALRATLGDEDTGA